MTEEKLPVPALNVNLRLPVEAPKDDVVKQDQIVKYYNEVFDDIRSDRQEIDEVLKNFIDMVINSGDASTSSKEAVVNLLKLKSETADKKTRVLDLLMRAYLKEKDTYPRYLAAHQENNFNITGGSAKRNLIKNLLTEEEEKKNEK